MAEFLVKAISATHSDPEKDKQGCYKRGDVVVIMPDGHEWGKEECLPKFVVVKVPGLDYELAKSRYEQPDYDLSALPEQKILMKRRYRVKIDSLKTSVKQQLNVEGTISEKWDNIRGCVEDKVLRITE